MRDGGLDLKKDAMKRYLIKKRRQCEGGGGMIKSASFLSQRGLGGVAAGGRKRGKEGGKGKIRRRRT